MTYETERALSGRVPVTLVEIDIDTCANVFSNSPCTATLNGAGLQCFNTFSTCQDTANYSKTVKTLRFCEDVAGLPVDFGAIPSVKSVNFDPTIIDPAKTLGIRAKTTITFTDHPYTDSTTDPYVASRFYDPLENGTYWAKFIARNPNYEGRPLRVTVGYFDDDNTFQAGPSREFVIDKIQGPDSTGKVQLIAKDVLFLAEDKKAKLPKASAGKLSAAIDDLVGSFSVGAGDGAAYDLAGTVRIDKELMSFTRSGDVFAVSRKSFGSGAQEHDADATVQQCLEYTDVNVIDIVRDLLLKAGIDSAFIPYAEWETERDDWLLFNEYSRVISKPTGVSQLLNEICEQSLISIWWDERVQEIKLKSMSPPLDISTIPTLTDNASFIKGSLQITRLTEQRITQLWLYSELKNQADDNKKQENYQQVDITVDAKSEDANSLGDVKERIILGTWLTGVGDAVKLDMSIKTINKFKKTPIKATFSCDAKDGDVWTGDIIFIETDKIQDIFGQPTTLIMMVTKARESQAGTKIVYEASTAFDYADRIGRWTEETAPDYTSATDAERVTLGFWTDDNGKNPDGTDGATWI